MCPTAWAINHDDGEPEYNAVDLRRISGMYLYPGQHRTGARQGVRPVAQGVVQVSGSQWTVNPLQAVVYPATSFTSGPYVVGMATETGSINPADISSPRLDAIDLQVLDDDEDASGEREVRVVYTAGTPASNPQPPQETPSALRLATILVPAEDDGSASIERAAQYTVSSGGILPVRDDEEMPDASLTDGMTVWHQELGMQLVRHNNQWRPTSSVVLLDEQDLIGAATSPTHLQVPELLHGIFREFRITVRAGVSDAGPGRRIVVRFNDSGDDGNYRFSGWANDPTGSIENVQTSGGGNPVMGFVGNFGPGVSQTTITPVSPTSASSVSWVSTSWSNQGGSGSEVGISGGRWAPSSSDPLTSFQVRTNLQGLTWSSGSYASLWGYV